ncbi:MAG: DUF3489 domain-containing protein [Hyphomicrobiaceae bacterium]
MKLSDTQLIILTAASQRDDRLALPLPDRLRGGAAAKVMASLIAKGLVEEVDAKRGDPVWRKTGDGHGVTLAITDAGLAVLGIEPEPGPAATANDKPRAPRKDSKQAQLIALLRRAKGATIDEIVEALDWQAHTVRGAIAGALKKKLGLTVVSEKSERRGRVYRITD